MNEGRLLGVLAGAAGLALMAEAAFPVGWRMDGTGRFPDATPPVRWSADRNILWQKRLDDRSNASPIVVGNRIFVCMEPSALVCVSAVDGTLLWERSVSFADILPGPDAEWARKVKDKGADLRKQVGATQRDLRVVNRKLKRSKDDADLKAKQQALKAKLSKLKKELDPLRKYLPPNTNAVNGYSSPTPTSDGTHVFVVFGTGGAACFDLAGNRKWAQMAERPTRGWGHSASPLLVGNLLIVHVNNVKALDKTTGRAVWLVTAKPAWGSPVHARVGNTDVIVTTGGDVIRASDGKVLARAISGLKQKKTVGLEYCAPIVDGNIVYFIQSGATAVQLPAKASEKLATKKLWTAKLKRDRYYTSPVLHEGLLYTMTRKQAFSVLDAKTGELVYTKNLDLKGKDAYPSMAVAGGYLYVSSEGGETLVLEPGRVYKEVSRNMLEPFRSTPLFVGDRVYVRGMKNLWCIAAQ